ncbi:MAG: SRPBCC domain-containing protein, partial [Anaerolineales bacterium]|nr:SRPBCC domain-containing protein [Anaerolineales bacterium]
DAELDVQVNGAFKVKFANANGTKHTAQGIYKEVEINKKLVFTWGWEEQPHIKEWVQVRFESEKDGTMMHFEHHDIDKETTHNYAEGWRSTFEKIERVLNS